MRLIWALLRNAIALIGAVLRLPLLPFVFLRRPAYVELLLEGRVRRRPPRRLWWQPRPESVVLARVRRAIDRLCRDPKALGLVVRVGRLRAGFALLTELREELGRVRTAGKRLVACLEDASTREYYVACCADTLMMAPGCTLDLRGFSVEIGYYADPLQRAGISVASAQAGRYKGAAERWTRDTMSEEMRESLGRVLERWFSDLRGAIAEGRGVEQQAAQAWIDAAPYDGEQARQGGLVDSLAVREELPERLAPAGRERVRLEPVGRYLRRRRRRWVSLVRRRRVAVVALEGAIVGGEATSGRLVADRPLRRVLQRIEKDRSVAGLVLAIDSPGGSASASDLMWSGVRRLARDKPVVASLGDVAASGGYYVAAACDAIVGQPQTVTGSIGVVIAKPNLEQLLARLGVATYTFSFGRRSTMFSLRRGWDDDARQALEQMLDTTYRRFIQRVSDGRALDPDKVDDIAQGRIWSGRDAFELRLIDKIGGVAQAVQEVERRARRRPGERFDVVDVHLRRRGMRASLREGVVEALLGDRLAPSLSAWLRLRDDPIQALGWWLDW